MHQERLFVDGVFVGYSMDIAILYAWLHAFREVKYDIAYLSIDGLTLCVTSGHWFAL